MKQFYIYIITSFCLTILLMSSFTLYRAHESIVDANATFENFIEVYQASNYSDEVITLFNQSDYEFNVSTTGNKKIVHMIYELKVLNEVLYKEIKAELLMVL